MIFIPTLPPPFGEVLIVGGVSVLGTEFEGPKRVMRSARDSLERAVGRELERDKPAEEDDTLTTSEAESTGSPDSLETDKPQTPKTTIGDRFKNFGRRHVLPFLDQVVGDRTEVKEENPTTNEESMGDEAKVDEPNDTTVTSPETSLEESRSAEGVVGEEHISL